MFELLFKYPPAIFSRGKLVLLSPWPWWIMLLLIAAAGAGLFWHIRHRSVALTGNRSTAIWLAQTALIALLLFMLWHPAISVARLRPQQNVVAVLVDHSRSMGLVEDGKTRLQAAQDLVNNELLPALSKKFQVRLYEFGHDSSRVDAVRTLVADDNATRIGDSLSHIASEAGAMPLGAVVMLTDGGDNTGGVDRETIAQLRQLRLPVHTIGFGPEHFNKDIELEDASVPARALPNSRLVARVTLRQYGHVGEKVNLTVRENGHPLAQRTITLKDVAQTEAIMFNSGVAGAHSFQVGVDPAPGEENKNNNALVRLVNVTQKKMRILYMEGEPRWEYKFIRRAVEDDQSIDLVSVVRTTQNKTYQQGGQQGELVDGFPPTAEGLDNFDGLVIGSVEANYFTPDQQRQIRDFADKRGGGVLFLAGRFALNDGGYSTTPMAEMMPLRLSTEKTFIRNFADVALTAAGRESVVTRLVDDRDANVARWKTMPQIANYATLGAPKPGAVVLMEATEPGHRPVPLLTVQNYGHGRTASSLQPEAGAGRCCRTIPI